MRDTGEGKGKKCSTARGRTGPVCVCSVAVENVHGKALMRFKNNGDYLHYSFHIGPPIAWPVGFLVLATRCTGIPRISSFVRVVSATYEKAHKHRDATKLLGAKQWPGRKLIIRSSIKIYAPCRVSFGYTYSSAP